jgi:hypothetical protein
LDPRWAGPLALCVLIGAAGTVVGGIECGKGHDYALAAQHESTTVGRIVKVIHGKSTSYRYEFSVNGVRMDDESPLCATPLEQGACENNGPVLVYYSWQPYSNSLLQDFAEARSDAFRDGKFLLAIGLPMLILPGAALVMLLRPGKSSDSSDVIHIVPGE